MNPKPKTVERLVENGKVGKVTWNGHNYYEVEAVKKATDAMRNIPPGYVRAVDHAILLGYDSRTASELCRKGNVPAKKVLVGDTKPSWFCDKEWLEKALAKTRPVKVEKPAPRPVVTTLSQEQANAGAIAELQATIAQLRDVIQNITNTPKKPKAKTIETPTPASNVTEKQLRDQGFRLVQELAKELEIEPSTIRGWHYRGQVRHQKIGGRVFVNVEDVERMYLRLDDNRALIAGRMGERTNNRLGSNGRA
jgi:hypothetical protein